MSFGWNPLQMRSIHALLQDIVEEGLISDAQLETVVYANMRFQNYLAGRESLPGARFCYPPRLIWQKL
jgi:hypothetical protein